LQLYQDHDEKEDREITEALRIAATRRNGSDADVCKFLALLGNRHLDLERGEAHLEFVSGAQNGHGTEKGDGGEKGHRAENDKPVVDAGNGKPSSTFKAKVFKDMAWRSVLLLYSSCLALFAGIFTFIWTNQKHIVSIPVTVVVGILSIRPLFLLSTLCLDMIRSK